MAEKKQTLKTILKEWLSPSLLVGLIVTLLLGYGKLEAYIKIHTFSTPEIKVLTENFIEKNIGISGRINLEAQNQLTIKYVGLTTAIDTLSSIHNFVYTVLETSRLRNEAILNLVHRQDSLITVMDADNKQMQKDINTGKNASELLLTEIRKLKALEREIKN